MKDLIREMVLLLSQGESLVLATLFTRSGSAPQTAGARMLIRGDGTILGTIGGGALEAQVQDMAVEAFKDRGVVLQEFVLTGEDASGMNMICGGRVEVLVEFIDATEEQTLEIYREVLATMEAHRRAWLLTALACGEAEENRPILCLIKEDGSTIGAVLPGVKVSIGKGSPVGLFGDGVDGTEASLDLTSIRHPVLVACGPLRVLIEPVYRAGTAVIFGAGHISQKLAPLCKLVGFETVIVDDRADFANRERFDTADRVVVHSFENVCPDLGIDQESYLIIVTRGHVHDQTVLAQALRTDAGYIGMIGSMSKRDATYQALISKGFSADDLARVHSPIGLSIGAETPEEIAVSIVGELVQARASRR